VNAVVSGSQYTNLALHRPAWQSSTLEGRGAERSVDGNKNPDWYQDSCSCTAVGDITPWLAVDLGEPTYIYGVNMTNRGDCCGRYYFKFVKIISLVDSHFKMRFALFLFLIVDTSNTFCDLFEVRSRIELFIGVSILVIYFANSKRVQLLRSTLGIIDNAQ
jgi:F5/8 type C domain